MKLQSNDSNRKRRRRPYVCSATAAVSTTLLLMLVASQSIHSTSAISGGRDRDDVIVEDHINDNKNDIDEVGDFNDSPLFFSGGTRRNRLLVHRNRLLALNNNDEESEEEENYGVEEDESGEEEDGTLIARLLGSHKGPHTKKKKGPPKKKKKNDQPSSSSSSIQEEKKLNKREKKAPPKKKKSDDGEEDKLKKLDKKGKKEAGGSKKTTMGKKEKKNKKDGVKFIDKDDGMKMDKKDKKLVLKNNNKPGKNDMKQKKDKKDKKEEWKAHGKSGKSKSSKSKSSKWSSDGGDWDKKHCECVKWSNDWNDDVELWTTTGGGGDGRFDTSTTTGIDKRDGTIDTTSSTIADTTEQISAAARFAMPNNRKLGGGGWTTTSSKSGKSKGSKKGGGDDDDDWDGWGNKKKCKEWKCDKPTWSSQDIWSRDGWWPTHSPSLSPTLEPTWVGWDDDWNGKKTRRPTQRPTTSPSSSSPTTSPSTSPTKSPSKAPTASPTSSPTKSPSTSPTTSPSTSPTKSPTKQPTSQQTSTPTKSPTKPPTSPPTSSPTNKSPTNQPTPNPTRKPMTIPPFTPRPTSPPTSSPTASPTKFGPGAPTRDPTSSPTSSPTQKPVPSPTDPITIEDAAVNDEFGKSIAITQTPVNNLKTAIIGAPGRFRASDDDAAYVFDLNAEGRWVKVPIEIDGVVLNKLTSGRQGTCGDAVAVFGNFYFVGCPSFNETATDSSSNAGIVEIYQRTGPNTFIRFQTLTPPGELGSSPLFGNSLAINKEGILVVGAFQASKDGVLGALGAVLVYRRNAQNRWEIVESLPRPDNLTPTTFGNFGKDVAIGLDQTIYVGAPSQINEAGQQVGALYVYKLVGNQWPLPTDPLSEGAAGDEFGWSVAVDDDGSLVVGAKSAAAVSQESGGVSRAGVVYEYDIETDGSIKLTQTLDARANAVEFGEYGYSVDLNNSQGTNNDYLVVGQRNPTPNGVGSIYIYKWSQLTSPDDHIFSFQGSFRTGGIEGRFGTAVAVDDANLLAGAPREDVGIFRDAGVVYPQNLQGTNTITTEPDARIPPKSTDIPTFSPSIDPTVAPSFIPTMIPTDSPVTGSPSSQKAEDQPELFKTSTPTADPTFVPSYVPTYYPTQESNAEPPKDLPKNVVSLSIPETRYLPWSSLSETEKKVAQVYLKYTQESWDQPGTNELENNSYDDLDSNGKAGAMSFGLSGEIWDCHINHYSGYYWADLEKGGIDQYYSVLGWNIDNWENDGPVPDTEEAHWDELSPDQQAAAGAVCYSKDLWNGNAITDWEA